MRVALIAGGGMLLGAALAVAHIVRVPESAPKDPDAVAWVNGRPISVEIYERALGAVSADRKGGGLREDDPERILQRLIDQELLIDRAIELGLHERDPQIRNQLSAAMMDFLSRRAEDDASAVDDSTLRAFYEEQSFRFTRPPRFRVDHAFVSGTDESARARAQAMASGAPWDAADPSVPLPPGLLLQKEVAQRLGPTVARSLAGLEPTETTVVEVPSGFYVVRLLERSAGTPAPFEEVRELVRAEYLRARGEAEVRDFLEVARQQSDIRLERGP
jgi:hypothetical protein